MEGAQFGSEEAEGQVGGMKAPLPACASWDPGWDSAHPVSGV